MVGISKVRVTDGFDIESDLEENINIIIAEEKSVVVDVKYVIEHDYQYDEEDPITQTFHRAMILFTDV
jgi:hypothetical protein